MTFPAALHSPHPIVMKKHSLLRLLKGFATAFFLAMSTDAAFAVADIVIEQPALTVIADGGSKGFGNVPVDTPSVLTFTIRNTGDAPLTVGAPSIDGINFLEFSASTPVGPIAAGGTATFTVTCTPNSTGAKTAALHLPNGGPGVKNPYDINLTATGTAPDISVDEAADNGTRAFGNVQWGGTPVSLTFTIRNPGTATLNLSPLPTIIGTSEFSITTPPAATVASGGSTTLVVTCTPTSRGAKNATLRIANNVAGAKNPYDITLTATGIAPVMSVTQGANIANNGTANFGTVNIGIGSKLLFTIFNTGDVNLTGLTITKDGANAADYTVTVSPVAPVGAPAGSTNFEVNFVPLAGANGNRTAAIHIASNDPASNPFNINLVGAATTPPFGSDSFGYQMDGSTPIDTVNLLNADGVTLPADVVEATLLVGDDVSQSINLGFTFSFYDRAYSTCVASTNGLLVFGDPSSSSSYVPRPIPNTSAPNNFIAPFWADLYRTPISRILYATRGQAPNRVFILQYNNMEQYAHLGNKVTFQLKLYEGTNTIEFQYKSIDAGWATTSAGFSSGIESRNYAAEPAPGLSNIIGIQVSNGAMNAGVLPQFPSAVRFTRPITVKVESKYQTDVAATPVDVGSPALGLNPDIGVYYSGNNYGDVKRFEAPEFIYLNKNFTELAAAGDVNDPDPLKVAWYRLVNDGYSIDGQVIQGTHTFFTTTLTHDVTVIWRWRLEYAVTIVSDTGQGGFGTPVPAVGRDWYPFGTQFTAAIDSVIINPGAGFRYRTSGYTVFNNSGAVVSPGNDPTSGPLPASPYLFSGDAVALARRGTLPITISQPLRVMWNFAGQVRYRFDALNLDQNGAAFNGQAFVRVYKPAPNRAVPDDTNYPPNGIVYSTGSNFEVWIDSGATTGRKVDVGVFYRTQDGSLTLSGFVTPPSGDLVTVTSLDPLNDDTSVPNQLGQTKVSRIYTVNHANAPTEVHWTYSSTVYRAEVPLGLSLDALDRNNQIKPPLPAGKMLKVADTGPGTMITTKVFPPTGSTSLGDPLRWDSLGKALFPVRPGVYEVVWPDDTDASKSYRIEVLTGYPGDTVTRTLGTLAADGSRLLNGSVPLAACATTDGSTTVTCASTSGLQPGMNVRGSNIPNGATVFSVSNASTFVVSTAATGTSTGVALTAWKTYQNTVVLPEVDPKAGFPAQMEHAHYHHLFDPLASRQAPTRLDLSATDEWKFQDMTYSDMGTGATVSKSTAGIPFTATAAGRSVLLYSYRPNPDEIADGTLTKENLAVRVVRSGPVTVIPRTDPKLVLSQRGLQLGGGAASSGGAFGIVGPAGSVNPGSQFVLDFWLNAKGLQSSSAVSLSNCTTNGTTAVTCASTAGLVAGMSVSGPTIAPGTKVASVGGSGTSFVLSTAATGNGTALSLTASYSATTLTGCATTNLSTTMTCASTADVVVGMSISGPNIAPGAKIAAKTNGTTLVLSVAATGTGTGLTLAASNKPVTVLTSGSGGLKVTLDAATSKVTASYRGISVPQSLSKAGAAWRHYVIHVFNKEVFGTAVTVLDFYLDGVRAEQALPTGVLQGVATSTVATTLGNDSFRFGVDADPLNRLQIDQFRLFSFPAFPTDEVGYLSPGEVRQLKTTRDMTVPDTTVVSFTSNLFGSNSFVLSAPATTSGSGLTIFAGDVAITNCSTISGSTTVTCDETTGMTVGSVVTGPNVVIGTRLRGTLPQLWFSFEPAPSNGVFANQVAPTTIGIGPVAGTTPYAGTWANVDVQEVATRIDSTLDNAGFGGSGFILNQVSNYNADLYSRAAQVGGWGPIFPVNDASQIYNIDPLKKLEVVYYENPYLVDRVPHPNVAWPYVTTEYKDVTFPAVGPHKDKAIYIASRIGSEGVDKNGRPQIVFDLARFSGLKIYNQPDPNLAGYNPNEEHALTAPSGRAAVKVKNLGESLANNPPLAAFALQTDVNNKPTYTSDPWVLVEVKNLDSGEPEMAAYRVFATRTGAIPFPRPADAQVGGSTGLAYEAAATPEDRFLTLNPGTNFNFEYKFDYPVFAGDLLVPPYPLNLVIGNVSLADERGGNIQVAGVSQRTLWRDASMHAWVVSGGGKFYEQFFYPMRADFYLPGADIGKPIAWLRATPTSLADFLGDNRAGTPDLDDDPKPVKVLYSSAWRSDYPKLKRGETVTYQGGEYFNENPGSNGLPAVVAMKAAEIVYDSATPSMVISDATTTELDKASARIIRPLDRREFPFTNAQMIAAGLIPGDPASSKVLVVAERWYFKDLTGSLQKRFYFDSLAETLVFRGRLNDKEGGDPNLTAGPDPINILEPNVMTLDDYKKTAPEKGIRDLSANSAWTSAIDQIFLKSQNPNGVTASGLVPNVGAPVFLQGVKGVPTETGPQAAARAIINEISRFFSLLLGVTITPISSPDPQLVQLDSFGVGSALVPNANLLTMPPTGSLYVTIAENNRTELNGAPVSLHIIEIIPDRYRGAIKVIEGSDAFSERITLQHNGEFGANTGNLDYEWWIRDSRELDDTLKSEIESLATALPDPNWQLYTAGPGLHTIVFQGRPDVVLADKLVLMRYRHQTETKGWKVVPFDLGAMVTLTNCTTNGTTTVTAANTTGLSVGMSVSGTNIAPGTKVASVNANGTTFVLSTAATGSGTGLSLTAAYSENTPVAAWTPGSSTVNAPFQWAGAANSPQFQADGSKRYIPQLVMGWVKRILDRINPYEARYTDFFSNESPASYSSQIQIAGGPYAGNVALNPDKSVIERTGLIELYRTVLARAEALSIGNSSNGNASDGINQALLLAATRLSVLYELLAREAYSDAQDSTISVSDDDSDGMASVASYTHAFQNLEPDLLHEELSLLRGTDFRKSYPVYNRMFWNYAKGLGEAAYNSNYNIYDVNTDGFINEDDARKLYPQGHGDAWGHFLSAVEMHYLLLQEPNFSWKARSELYSLMQNVFPVDYLDEKTFARLAAGKARAGRDIVRATYRLSYTNDPDGQWQGYTDGADKARAWGVSEWAHRAGQGAYFDWAVANALLPAQALDPATGKPLQNLSEIERSGAVEEIAGVAGGLHEIQTAMDESNTGANPLGFSSDSIAFDIDPTLLYVGSTAQIGTRAVQGLTHFEQIYERALISGKNAADTLKFAVQANNKLRIIANDTESLIIDSLRQDLDYRNRLIEIFGRPYTGQIGFGKAYPEGYEGPDTMLYAYLDKTTIDQIVPSNSSTDTNVVTFTTINTTGTGMMSNATLIDIYNKAAVSGNITNDFKTWVGNSIYGPETASGVPFTAPYNTASKYGFQAPADWGQRTSYGKAQTGLGEMLSAEIALDSAIADYIGYLQDYEQKLRNLQSELELFAKKDGKDTAIVATRASIHTAKVVADGIITTLEIVDALTDDVGKAAAAAVPEIVGFSNSIGSPIRGAALVALAAGRSPIAIAKQVVEIAKEVADLISEEVIASLERDKGYLDEVGTIQGLVAELEYHSGGDQPKRDAIGMAVQELELKKQEYFTALSEGFRLLREREAFNKVLAAKSQKNRYQDMIMRLTRNEAMAKYQSAFSLAARYAWLSAKAYDYETSLDPGDPAAATQMFDQIVKERQLGLWTDGFPKVGKGGLAELLATLRADYDALEGRIGLNHIQVAYEGMSFRAENFRIGPTLDPAIQAVLDLPPGTQLTEEEARLMALPETQQAIADAPASNDRWKDVLKSCLVDDLWQVPEFRLHCRPFADPSAGRQPGLVIRFSSVIEPGQNFFGRPLVGGDHAYSISQFATRIAVAGVVLKGYPYSDLATTPRAYLIPVGTDYCRVSTSQNPVTRSWSVKDVRIPIPYVINQAQISSPGFIPPLDGIDGSYGDVRRHADFRMFHEADGDHAADDDNNSTRLMARSVWNSQWLLIIPGAGLYYDSTEGVKRFTENVSDIMLNFKTYSHNGQ